MHIKRKLLGGLLAVGLLAGAATTGAQAAEVTAYPATYDNKFSTINKCTGGSTNLSFAQNLAYDRNDADAKENPGEPVQVKPMYNFNYAPVIVVHGYAATNGDQHDQSTVALADGDRPAFSQQLTGRASGYAHPAQVDADTSSGEVESYTELRRADYEDWKTPLTRSLVGQVQHNRGFAVYSFDYSKTQLGKLDSLWVTNSEIGPKLRAAINCLYGATQNRVTIIAHSMGGLATRYAMGQDWQTASHVGDIFTYATPNLGSIYGYGESDSTVAVLNLLTAALLNRCSLKTTNGQASAKDYATYNRCKTENTNAVTAFVRNSPVLAKLPTWDDIRASLRNNGVGDIFKLHAFAGDNEVVLGQSLFDVHLEHVLTHGGDTVVGVKSALFQANDNTVAICKFHLMPTLYGVNLSMLNDDQPSSPDTCTHGPLTYEARLAGYLNDKLAGAGSLIYGERGYYGPLPDLKFNTWRDLPDGTPGTTGKSIGPLTVDMTVDQVTGFTGKTYDADDTVGDVLSVAGGWANKVSVSLILNKDKRVDEIRVSSPYNDKEADIRDWTPWAKNGVTIGSNLADIQRAYPGATAVTYKEAQSDNYRRVQIPDAGGYITFMLYKDRVIMFEAGNRTNETEVPLTYHYYE